MPTVWQPNFKPMSTELYSLLDPKDKARYTEALTLQTALASPLDYAMYVSPQTEEYEHITVLNGLIVALVEHRLYKQEYGACSHATATNKNGQVRRSGHPIYAGNEADEKGATRYENDNLYFAEEPCHVPDGTMPVDRLFVTMPPRHGKSYLISEHLAPWLLSRYPNRNVLLASYEADFAATWGKKAKDHVQAHPEFGIATDPESQAKANWKLGGADRGGMNTAGAGGPITGKGGTLIIDDPIKNDEEANSETDRESKYNWLVSTAITRMEPGDVTIMVHTRWHDDDLGGRVMKKEPNKWYHIDFPALQPAENVHYADDGVTVLRTPDNLLQRDVGAALCPARYDREYLEDLRMTMGSYWFGALYQQRPTSLGKGIFKSHDFRYWRPQSALYLPGETLQDPDNGVYVLLDENYGERYILKKECRHFMTVDLAASTKTSADFTVFATWAVSQESDLILVDRIRDRMESADHISRLSQYWQKMKVSTNVLFIGIETATFGLTMIQNARRKGLPIRKLVADKDKVSRAIPAGALTEAHKVFFPRSVSWLEEWESELTAFDKGAHDDQVDVMAYAAQEVVNGTLMLRQIKQTEPVTMEERIAARLNRKKGKTHHPELGRI